MPRPALEVGTYGRINVVRVSEDPDKWRARAYYRFRDGKLRQVERFSTSEAKAVAALKSALKKVDGGRGGAISSTMRLERLALRFLEEKRAANRTTGTLETYQAAIRAHVVPGIGRLMIGESTPELLQEFLSRINEDHGHGAAKNCRSVLSGMFGLAVRNGAADRNPVRELERITKRGKIGSEPLLPEQLPAFLESINGDAALRRQDHVDKLFLMAGTGMRIGEVCALTWDAVSLEESTITVQATAVRVKGRGMMIQSFPKTTASHRTIDVADSIVERLRARRAFPQNSLGLVFTSARGKVSDPNNVERDWRDRREALGFPNITTHSLRKLVATMLDEAGMTARDIADYLGHEDPSITQDIYMARNRDSRRAALVISRALTESTG